MTETTLRLAFRLAQCESEVQARELLVAAPHLSPADLMEVLRHPEDYRIPDDQARALRSRERWLAKTLQALTGGVDAGVPARLYGQLAMTSRNQGKLDQAKRFYRFAFANATSSWEQAAALSGMAIIESDPCRARALYRQAEEICERNGVGGPTLAYIFNNLGTLEMGEGHLELAAQLFEKARIIAANEEIADVYVLARINEAELAHRLGRLDDTSRCLDDIRWIEGSGSPHEPEYHAARRRVAGLETESPMDWRSKTIEELEELLVSPINAADRFLILQELGDKYHERRDGQRIDNLRQAVSYWEQHAALMEVDGIADKVIADAVVKEILPIAEMHRKLGNAFNELDLLDNHQALSGKAQKHFEKALEILPKSAEYATHRRTWLNDYANAIASNAKNHADGGLLHKSLEIQSELLATLDAHPVERCVALVNMSQTYRELTLLDPHAARADLYEKAWSCLVAAEEALSSDDQQNTRLALHVATAKADTAVDMLRSSAELARLRERLNELLPADDLRTIQPERSCWVLFAAARLALALREKARVYRLLLNGMRMLGSRIAGGSIPAERVRALEYGNHLLVSAMTEWGEVERAAFFASTLPAERLRTYAPGRRWKAPAGSCAVLFADILPNRLAAFVISPSGIRSRDLPVGPLELMRIGAEFANPASERIDDGQPLPDQRLAAVTSLTDFIGEKLFRPIEDLLPDRGSLAVIPSRAMATLPLHLAVLTGAKRLLDLYEVTYCSRLSFDAVVCAAPRPSASTAVFVAGYSPRNARLPFGDLEVRAVAAIYAPDSQLESGENATPEAVLRGLLQARVAHLCCHGAFDWESPLDSKLFFAVRPLSMREIQLSLSQSPCDLIVLSACETGMRFNASTGKSDFVSILLRAGCGIVISADWRVDDLSTAVLMEKVHRALAQAADPATALAVAQRSMQTETGRAVAAQVRNWIDASDTQLPLEELVYLTQAVDALAGREGDAVFAHPVYWGLFSTSAFCFHLERAR
jgi:CHAT domain-containing protein/tetratricopeptide (TPR) repeat protein